MKLNSDKFVDVINTECLGSFSPQPTLPFPPGSIYICKFRDPDYIQLTPVCHVQQRFSCTTVCSYVQSAESVF